MPDVRLSSRSLTPVLCAVGLACALQGEVQAADGGPRDAATAPRVFDIAPGELAEVLLNIVRQGHVPIAFDQRLVAGLRGPDIRGRLSVEDALRRALAGSGLAYAQDESGAFVLRGGQAPVQETRGAAAAPTLSTVVVTGTRKSDVKAQDSLSPIDVVSATQLRSSGAVDLRDALVKLLPSLTRQAQPFNASALTHTQSLRGLSPNHVLVLVNGKRRYETANLNISGGLEKGSTGVDLDTIPINAIERVEVLRDGASAQYGSDAIAGVINVILKSADHGGSAAADVGQTGDGDGFTHGGGGNIGLAFGDSGFVNLTAEYREQERTMRSGIDERTGRRDNISMGDPAFHRQSLALNSGFGLGDDIEVYGFGTYTRRKASSAANYRLASVAPTLYPDGFTPRPNSDEDDYAFLAGVRGERLLDAWHWDLSSGYGADRPDIGMTQSVNAAIYRETGNSPRSFDLARYRNSQWTSNLDLGREFQLDFLAAPLALSLGAEYRRESYRIDAGDPASYYSGGAESLAGLSPLSEGQWSRHAWA
ncbi:TPA: TonB-dependent receptor plug domain-containing protein, partial [Pseudomonas aeruginosa]